MQQRICFFTASFGRGRVNTTLKTYVTVHSTRSILIVVDISMRQTLQHEKMKYTLVHGKHRWCLYLPLLQLWALASVLCNK